MFYLINIKFIITVCNTVIADIFIVLTTNRPQSKQLYYRFACVINSYKLHGSLLRLTDVETEAQRALVPASVLSPAILASG